MSSLTAYRSPFEFSPSIIFRIIFYRISYYVLYIFEALWKKLIEIITRILEFIFCFLRVYRSPFEFSSIVIIYYYVLHIFEILWKK